MAKIVVFGDIDIASLYISIDGCKEITVSGKHPQSFPLATGSHEISATTISKIERMTKDFGAGGSKFLDVATTALQNSTNTTIGGVLDFAEDDVLLIKVEQRGFKTNVYNKMVSEAEAAQYVDVNTAVTYGGRKRGKKFKWLAWLLLVLFGVLAFLFLWVFMMEF